MSGLVVLVPAETRGGRHNNEIQVRWAFEGQTDDLAEAIRIAENAGAIQTGWLQGLYPQVVTEEAYMRLPIRAFPVKQMPSEFRREASGICERFLDLLLRTPVAA